MNSNLLEVAKTCPNLLGVLATMYHFALKSPKISIVCQNRVLSITYQSHNLNHQN